jgi:Protein of unknown function (DUF1453)
MNQQDTLHALLPYLPFVILILLLFRRTQRARVLNPGRLWIMPVIFLVFAGFYVAGAMRQGPELHAQDWIVMVASAAVGAAVGALRAHFVHLTRRTDNGLIEMRLSVWGLVFILAWVAGRQLIRQSGWVNASAPFGVYADAGLSLALGLLVTQAIVLSRRCQALLAENKPSAANVPDGAA